MMQANEGEDSLTTAYLAVKRLDNGANNSNTDFMAVYFELS